jgi:predicted NAD/FAD-binding protein
MYLNDSSSSLFEEINRRELAKGLTGVVGLFAAGSMIGCGSDEELASHTSGQVGGAKITEQKELLPVRQKIAVIGGGIGGISSAYFLSPVHDVEVFEARPKIGGHCDSLPVTTAGHEVIVDLGAQFFHPDTHPIYVTLLSQLGLLNEKSQEDDKVIDALGSLTIFPMDQDRRPYFSSRRPWRSPRWTVDFAIYSRYARSMITENGSWTVTLENWIASLPVSASFKEKVLTPWIAALIGTTVENAKRSSARSILQTFALAFPSNILQPASTCNSTIGLGGFIDHLAAMSPGLKVHVNAQVESVEEIAGQWFITSERTGRQGPFDAVIVNAMPHASHKLIKNLSWASELTEILGAYEYFDARMLIHEDPIFMPKDRRDWAVYNAGIQAGECEGSVWVGAIHSNNRDDALSLFKSWAQQRHVEPRAILAERRFRHPLLTPKVLAAAKRLQAWQGRKNLWFAGQHTLGMDLQEAGVFSAMQVAKNLAPMSPSLTTLENRLRTRGLANVNYTL